MQPFAKAWDHVFVAKPRAGKSGGLILLDPAPEPSDLDLARRIAQGERWAEEAFYRRYAAQVLALAQRLLGNSWDAEDVTQETFVTAFEIWHQLREQERARSWLMQIAVRKVHRQFRRRRLLRLLGLERSWDDLPLEALARDDTSAELRSELQVLDLALKSLAPKAKIPWMLRYVEGLPLEEVADRCECSLSTAKRRIADAQRVVARHLTIEEEGDD
ncbi:MAG TPA: RNA polymerase sigma factor [Polyangiaceae bacterium]|nr:RNA polymerase sigma factor [Polyangiaceae bacterium]